MKRTATIALLVIPALLWLAFARLSRKSFPAENTPEGAYARIVLAISEGHPGDCFAYLETQAQWATFTIRDYHTEAAALIAQHYPEPERSRELSAYGAEARLHEGPEVWVALAERHGFLQRLRRDLSGVLRTEISGDRATVETARGTRYAFRRRENGLWGLTMFTAELLAESEKAARDLPLVRRAAQDYERAAHGQTAPSAAGTR
jgi:hypothetical protein